MMFCCTSVRRIRQLTVAAAIACGAMVCASNSFAQVTGSVKLDGKAPEAKQIDMSGVKECNDQHPDPVYDETIVADDNGNLANVVVAIKSDDPSSLGGEASKDTVVLDQKGCMYSPHVIAMSVGQPMKIKNDDPFLHNVHSLSQQNPPFNFGQPNKDEGKPVDSPKTAEKYRVKCDVHPWMSAYIAVFDHPFFAVSDEKGQFSLPKGLPDGDYKLEAWHEQLGTQEGSVTVKDGKGTVNFTFKPGSATGPAPAIGKEILISTDASAGSCAACDTMASKKEKDAK